MRIDDAVEYLGEKNINEMIKDRLNSITEGEDDLDKEVEINTLTLIKPIIEELAKKDERLEFVEFNGKKILVQSTDKMKAMYGEEHADEVAHNQTTRKWLEQLGPIVNDKWMKKFNPLSSLNKLIR